MFLKGYAFNVPMLSEADKDKIWVQISENNIPLAKEQELSLL